ncbi:MAG: SDR family oxidoreductase [Acidimicrobiales bacterium]
MRCARASSRLTSPGCCGRATQEDRIAKRYPLKRLGTVEDIANAALYLGSDASSWVTGQRIILDGGGLVAFPG